MTTVAAKKVGWESPPRFHLREKLGNLHFFSVDGHNRWPLQGWSSGDEAIYNLDEELVAEECARPFTLDHKGRWPLQGWCKPTSKAICDESAAVSAKPSVRGRWPQGW